MTVATLLQPKTGYVIDYPTTDTPTEPPKIRKGK